MIRRIYIDNYKCLVNFELQVDALTLILGANGAGKSAILDVLVALRQLLDGTVKVFDRDAFPGSTCTRWQAVNTQVVPVGA
jgi:predicted ATPase